MKKIRIYSTIAMLSLATFSCKKWLEIKPENALAAEEVINNKATAQQVLNGCYDVLGNIYDGHVQAISEMLADNLNSPSNNDNLKADYNRQSNVFNDFNKAVYLDFYRIVFRANTLIDNIDLVADASENEKNKMVAEAQFLRALCHWQVCRLWSQPYGYSADNSHLGVPNRTTASSAPIQRNTVKENYDFILSDLQFAYENLPLSNGVYATKYSAAGLLAEVYFLMNDFGNSVFYSSEVINSGQFSLIPNHNRFPQVTGASNNNNSEMIFGIVSTEYSTGQFDRRCEFFIDRYKESSGLADFILSADFGNLMALDSAADSRFDAWISLSSNKYFLRKTTMNSSYSVPIVQLTALKLIRAEALAETGTDLTTAIDDVNDIRNRAFATGTNELPSNASASDIIEAARIEYRIETIAEGRWLDQLKRRGTMGENILIRDAPWNCAGMVLQFHADENTAVGFQLNPEGGCN